MLFQGFTSLEGRVLGGALSSADRKSGSVAQSWSAPNGMPLLYMVPSTVLNAETRARRPFLIVFRLSLTSSLSLRMESSTRLPSSVWRVLSDAGDGYGRPAASKSRWTASLLPTLKTKMEMSMLSCTSIAELYASLGAMLQTKLCRDSFAFCVTPMAQESRRAWDDNRVKRGLSSWKIIHTYTY